MQKTDEQLMINAMYYISMGLILATFITCLFLGSKGATIERLQNDKDSLIRCVAQQKQLIDSIDNDLYITNYELGRYANTMEYLYDKYPKTHEKVIEFYLHQTE